VSQKEELFLLKNQAKHLNMELVDEVKVILKNLKKNVMSDPNMQSFSNSLKTEINQTFEQINGALHDKVESLKNYNYK
jgi:Na+/phosphate symporter